MRAAVVARAFRCAVLACALAFASPVLAAESPDWDALGREAVDHLAKFLQFDTTNPPGNETPAAVFLKALLDREGIESRVIESAPGRGNVYARLRGDGSRKPIVLLNHLDVVPADARFWAEPPFSGAVKDGYVWGRGALDMKGMGILQLMTMLVLKRQGTPLKGDVIFLGTADEENGGRAGAGAITRDHFDLVQDASVVLTEGAVIFVDGGGRRFYSVSVSEKVPFPVLLRARGTPGHGSQPGPDSAVNRLVAALGRLMAYQSPIVVLPEVQRYYAQIAETRPSPWRERFADLSTSLRDPAVAAEFTRRPTNNARVRNTFAVTMLEGSNKVNVIPAEATARLDVRLLPGQDPAAFVEELRRVIADETVLVDTGQPFASGASPIEHPLIDVIASVVRESEAGASIQMSMLNGATDCRYFRVRGIPCYGFVPFGLTARDLDGFHGNDERVSVQNVVSGTRVLYEIVRRFAAE